MPTALASPWPSGPVVVSTPGGDEIFRMARRERAELAEALDLLDRHPPRSRADAAARRSASSRDRPTARSGRGRARSDRPDRISESGVNSTVAMSAAPIGRPGWPDFACSTASMASARMALAMRSCCARDGAPADGAAGAGAAVGDFGMVMAGPRRGLTVRGSSTRTGGVKEPDDGGAGWRPGVRLARFAGGAPKVRRSRKVLGLSACLSKRYFAAIRLTNSVRDVTAG